VTNIIHIFQIIYIIIGPGCNFTACLGPLFTSPNEKDMNIEIIDLRNLNMA